ncbi:Hsp70 family protein [Dactylosporangium cerinum]|uniref:Hsp70 family protein n=1 Tax=Dactylosporangium cerinum TaxID=1434730 RepID=A0ABV9W6B1_9ACTN
MGGYQLSVDFGTSSTVAVLAGPDGEHHPLLFDGEEFLPSATCLDNAPHLLVGRDALVLGQAHPDRLAAYPKRAVDSGAVVLGGVECPVGDLYAAVLARVAAEARRVAGEPMSTVTLTHPACWDRRRQATLTRAAAKVGLGPTRLVAEPVAAARHVLDSGTLEVDDGAALIVYDLGAGSFDAAVLRRSGPTFDLLAQRGLSDAGGLDLDMAIAAHLGRLLADDTIRWERLARPQSVEDCRAARRLLDEVRAGKELLSVAGSTTIRVPLFDEVVPLSRADLERIARPLLDRTISATVAAVAEAGVTRAEVAGLLLIGGSSRIPLVARVLREALGVEPTAIQRPKLAVADGCLPVRPRNPARRPEPTPVAAPTPSPASEPHPSASGVREPAASEPRPPVAGVRGPAASEPRPPVAGVREAAASEPHRPASGVPPFRPAAFGTAPPPRLWPESPVVEPVDVPVEHPPSLLDRVRRRRSRPRPPAAAVPQPAAKLTRSRAARVVKVAAGTVAGSVLALAAGVWGGFVVAPSESFSTIQVGQCVRQDGAEARRVDCAEADAYTVTARVYPAGSCPDPAQPYAMQELTQLCLAPTARRPVGPMPVDSSSAGPKSADPKSTGPKPTASTRRIGP